MLEIEISVPTMKIRLILEQLYISGELLVLSIQNWYFCVLIIFKVERVETMSMENVSANT